MAKKSGLGRGLGLLVGEADAETAGMRPDSTLPISEIKPSDGIRPPRQLVCLKSPLSSARFRTMRSLSSHSSRTSSALT